MCVYMYVCVCVCVSACVGACPVHTTVSLLYSQSKYLETSHIILFFVVTAVEEKVQKERDMKKSEFAVKSDNNSQDTAEKQKAILDQEKAKQERSLLREKDKEKQKGKKRGMDVDVVTRFTTSSSKPKKAKEEEAEKEIVEKEDDDKQIGKYLPPSRYSIVIVYLIIDVA